MRLLLACCLVFAIGGQAVGDDVKKPEAKPASRADRLKAIQSELNESKAAIIKEFQATKDPKEQQSLRAKWSASHGSAATKAMELAAEDPKDAVGLDAALFVVQNGQGIETSTRAIELLVANHASSPKMASLIAPLAQQGEAGVKHLRTLYDKSTDKTLKGQALFAIGSSLVDSADSQAMSPDKQAAAFKEAEQTMAAYGRKEIKIYEQEMTGLQATRRE